MSIDCVVRCNDISFRENILFTHTGLSGPASLQASLYWNSGDPVEIDLLPSKPVDEWLKGKVASSPKMELKNALADLFAQAVRRQITASPA